MKLGNYIGSYRSTSIPLWASVAIRIGWLRRRYARHNISELQVYEEGVVLKQRHGEQQTALRLEQIRRVWWEEFHTGSEHEGNLSYRIDLIAQNLDVLFSLTGTDCPTTDDTYLLMKGLHDRWKRANWKHYHVVAAIVRMVPSTLNSTPHYLCMQKPDTRYAYTSRHWEFPGGKVEAGETEPEALKRELMEEMEYEVTVEKHLITVDHSYPDFGITLSCWLCSAVSDTFVRKEHIDHRWLPLDEMKELEWCAADEPVLDALANLH